MRHSSQTLRRSAAILCASGLAMSGLLLSAPTAFGANTETSATTTDYGASNIDPSEQASLTIHKYANKKDKTCTANEATRTGTQSDLDNVDTDNCETLDGVTFTAYPVLYKGATIDLTKNAGWDAVKALKTAGEANFINGFDFKDGGDFAIDKSKAVAVGPTSSGSASANLGKTLYFVKETEAPAKVTTKTASFFVTMPLSQANGGWLYAVHAYPKNVVDSSIILKKEVGEASSIYFPTTGGPTAAVTMPYTITVPVGSQSNGFKSGKVEDQLVAGLGVSGTSDVTAAYDGKDLTADTDYTVSLSTTPSGSPAMAYGTKITVTLTAEGLKKIGTGGASLTVKINATVKPGASTGALTNTFTKEFIPTGKDADPDPTVTPGDNDTPTTNPGLAKIRKFDASKGSTYSAEGALSGVKFKVYPAAAGSDVATQCTEEALADAQEYTTQKDGTVDVDVTVYSGPKLNAATTKAFCITETETVAGFDLPSNPTQVVTLNATRQNIDISNSKSTGTAVVTLPLTGAAGQLLLTVAGIALIGGGALWLVAARRRRNEDA